MLCLALSPMSPKIQHKHSALYVKLVSIDWTFFLVSSHSVTQYNKGFQSNDHIPFAIF